MGVCIKINAISGMVNFKKVVSTVQKFIKIIVKSSFKRFVRSIVYKLATVTLLAGPSAKSVYKARTGH